MRNYWRTIEFLWILLLGVPILVPGKITALAWHPYLILAAFLFPATRWISQRIVAQKAVSERQPLTYAHPLILTCYVLALFFAVSLWVSVDHTTSWIAEGYILWGLALFTIMTQWRLPPQKLSFIAMGFMVSGVMLAISVLPFVSWKADFRLFHLPIYDQLTAMHIDIGETIHANILASVLALILPLWLAVMLQASAKLRVRMITGFVFLTAFVILLLTQSRGAYLAMLLALPVVVILRWPKLIYATLLGIPLLVVAIFYLGTYNILDLLSQDGSLGGWDVRIDIWTHSLHAIHDFPFTGIGFGTFTTVMPLLYPLKYPIEGYPHAHNLFLQIGVDLGVGGLVAYCAILLTLFAMLFQTLRIFPRQSNEWALTVGALGSLVAMLVHGLLDAATWISKIAFFPWLLFALITLLFLQAKRDEGQTEGHQ